MNVPNNTKGFTIIEVVLVLAIAGLIFLVVFLALPALQRGQRDNQRKQDLSRLMSQAQAFQSNNQGALPIGSWNDSFKTSYLTAGNAQFSDPSTGVTYNVAQQTGAPSGSTRPTVEAGNIFIYPGMSCTNTGTGLTGTFSTSSRSFAALIHQEQGGSYCQSNN